MAAPVDDHHLLARYRRGELPRWQHEAINAAIVARRDELRPGRAGERDPVDAIRARGVPILGPGSAGGAIPGTRPDYAILKLDRKRRVRSRRKL